MGWTVKPRRCSGATLRVALAVLACAFLLGAGQAAVRCYTLVELIALPLERLQELRVGPAKAVVTRRRHDGC